MKTSVSYIFAALLVGILSNCSAAPQYETEEDIRSVAGPPLYILFEDAGTQTDSGQDAGTAPGANVGPGSISKKP